MNWRLLFTVLVLSFSAHSAETVKVAVLDNSFEGYADAIGRSLPGGTTYHAGTVESPKSEPHGLAMAQLLARFLRGQTNRNIPYELHLYQTYGFTNFSQAVDDIVKNKIAVVLYSQVWEYGGNSDGKGFINAVVDKAVDAGVLWINAAGNFGQGTFNFDIKPGEDGWLKIPANGVHFRCNPSREMKCDVRAVLSWNDFRNDIEQGTNKDLDLFLERMDGERLASSELVQRRMLDKDSEKFSKYPREILQTTVGPGDYMLRIKAASRSWTPDDTFKVTVSGEGIVTRANPENESLLNPADNPKVVTVGACDTSDSSISISQRKPELIAPSIVNLPGNSLVMGSSVAASLVAAAAVALRSAIPNLQRDQFLQMVTLARGQRRPEWQWNVPNFSMCRPVPFDFVKIFVMPTF